jgi:hypothetical protein
MVQMTVGITQAIRKLLPIIAQGAEFLTNDFPSLGGRVRVEFFSSFDGSIERCCGFFLHCHHVLDGFQPILNVFLFSFWIYIGCELLRGRLQPIVGLLVCQRVRLMFSYILFHLIDLILEI